MNMLAAEGYLDMHEVFISYRRGDTVAEDVRNFLERGLYPGAVFIDVFDLTAGEYSPELEAAIRSSKVVIVVVGRVWELKEAQLAQASDVVRREILTAKEARVRLVPLLFGRASLDGLSLPAEIRDALGDANSIYLEIRDRSLSEAVLRRRLLPLILPHLPEYWRRKARARRAQAVVAGIAAAALLAIIAGALASGLDVAELQRRAFVRKSFYQSVPLELSTAVSYLDRRATDTAGNSAAERRRNEMDPWIDRINQSVEAMKPAGQSRLMVATYDFDRHYQNFSGWLTIGNPALDVSITEVYAFLVRNDGPSATYRPVYRQMEAVTDPRRLAQVRDRNTTMKLTSVPITIRTPDPGERLFLLMVVSNSGPTWPDPEAFRLTLEVH